MQTFVLVSQRALIFCAAFLLSLQVQASLITVDSYTYGTAPDSSGYKDSGGELTDGITASLAWGDGISIGLADVVNLTGWLNSAPTITFNFATAQLINNFKVFAADSDNYAGVSLPESILLSTAEGFSQLFSVSNPAGNGSVVALEFAGFATTSNAITLSMAPSSSWTMLSEVQFFYDTQSPTASVPAPEALAIMLCGMAFMVRRKLFNK